MLWGEKSLWKVKSADFSIPSAFSDEKASGGNLLTKNSCDFFILA